MFPVYYSAVDFTSTAPVVGAYPINTTHPVTNKTEYGSVLNLPGIGNSSAHYGAQVIVSSSSGQASPVHMYMRRLTSTPSWSEWSTVLDDSNYTTYTVKKDGTGASGTWNITATTAQQATHAATANSATTASQATHAATANSATTASEATHAATANSATTASEATHAATANSATTASYSGTAAYATKAASADKWTTARTLTIGNKGQSVDGSANVTWDLHDILKTNTNIGAETSWDQYTPGVYYVASGSTFTGAGNPETPNGGLEPYHYGQVIVSRAGTGGVAEIYISHQDSGASNRGIKYRSGWNSTYNSKWDTILDSTNYTQYTVKKDGTGASGSWSITASTASYAGTAGFATTASQATHAATANSATTASNATTAGFAITANFATTASYSDTAGFATTANYSCLNGIEYIVGTQTASTGTWTGITTSPSIYTGKTIAYKLPYAGSGSATLALTLPDGTTASAAVYLNATRVTTHYSAGAVILMTFDGTYWRSTDYWNSNSRDAGYGSIALTQSTAETAITTNTTTVAAKTYNEKITLTAGNKWVEFAGTNSSSNNADVLTVAHSLSGVTAGDYGDSTAQTPGYGATFNVPDISVDAAGHITAISSHTVAIPASDNTNTTYTFADGTNGFTVTPLGGSAQTVTVTPSITNNITGSGTSGYLTKFTGANTIGNGPQIGTGTTTFLRNDGSWATPSYATTSAFASTATRATGANITTTSGGVAYYSNTTGTFANDADLTWDATNNSLHIVHAAGKDPGEVRITYSTTVDMGLGVGSANKNHGLYDFKASKWMVYADQDGNVKVNGNADTATTAGFATTASEATHSATAGSATTATEATHAATANTASTATWAVNAAHATTAHFASTATRATGANISTTTNAIAKYASATGTFADSGVTIDASNNLSTPANIYAGNTTLTSERNIKVQSAAGTLYLYSTGSTTGNRGLYGVNSAGTAVSVLTVSTTNVVTLNGKANTAGTAQWAVTANRATDATKVAKAGDTMTGNLLGNKTNTIGSTTIGEHFYKLYLGGTTTGSNAINSANPLIEFADTDRSQYGQLIYTDYDSVRSPDGLTWVGNQANSWFQAPRVFGAVWNDYAEYRETKDDIQPGRCVIETGKGDLVLSTERLQPGCEIVSDTFGFAIGETKICKTPTACAGRVLAYLYENNSLAKPGDPVCSGPNGTVSIMTHEEEKEWPSRIIGTVSEIPDYKEWEYGSADEFGVKNKLKVDGRIWIRIR